MLEFKRKIFEFKLDDKVHRVTHPTIKQVQDLSKKTEGKAESEGLEVTIDFLAGLGLPKEVAYGMEPEHLTTVVNHVSGQATK